MRIAVDGPMRDGDGYSSATRGAIVGLARIGADVASGLNWGHRPAVLEPEVEEAVKKGHGRADFGVRFSQPDSASMAPGAVKVCFSMWEFTSVPTAQYRGAPGRRVISWPEGMEECDAHFVPCEFSRNLWIKAGCTKPVHVVPLGYDDRIYTKREREEGRPFTFISAGTLSSRKNPNMLLKCFRELFGDDPGVRLIFKSASHLPLKWPELPANVEVINENWPHAQIADLYASADVFVNPTQGEGFGLPLVESMATGLPVIVTGWSAPVDFVTPDVGWLLDYEERSVGSDWYFEDGSYQRFGFVQPTEASLKERLLYAYEHPDEVRTKGEAAAAWVKGNYTWEHTARRMMSIFEKWEVANG